MAFYLNVVCDRSSRELLESCQAQLRARQKRTGRAPKWVTDGDGGGLEGSIALAASTLSSITGGEKERTAATTDALCEVVSDLAWRAVAHFGYFCDLEDVLGQGLFSVALVKDLRLDRHRAGLCALPPSAAASFGSGCGADVHGEYHDRHGFEFVTTRCGLTLPIAMEHVAELVQKMAKTTYEGCELNLTAIAVAPHDERSHLMERDSVSFKNVKLPDLDLEQAACVYGLVTIKQPEPPEAEILGPSDVKALKDCGLYGQVQSKIKDRTVGRGRIRNGTPRHQPPDGSDEEGVAEV